MWIGKMAQWGKELDDLSLIPRSDSRRQYTILYYTVLHCTKLCYIYSIYIFYKLPYGILVWAMWLLRFSGTASKWIVPLPVCSREHQSSCVFLYSILRPSLEVAGDCQLPSASHSQGRRAFLGGFSLCESRFRASPVKSKVGDAVGQKVMWQLLHPCVESFLPVGGSGVV